MCMWCKFLITLCVLRQATCNVSFCICIVHVTHIYCTASVWGKLYRGLFDLIPLVNLRQLQFTTVRQQTALIMLRIQKQPLQKQTSFCVGTTNLIRWQRPGYLSNKEPSWLEGEAQVILWQSQWEERSTVKAPMGDALNVVMVAVTVANSDRPTWL